MEARASSDEKKPQPPKKGELRRAAELVNTQSPGGGKLDGSLLACSFVVPPASL